jgi:hypothetical protein
LKKDKHWNDYANHHLNDFVQYNSESLNISPEEFMENILKAKVGNLYLDILYSTFIETFYQDENVVNAYLKKRKWKHSSTATTILEQSRDSFFSIYEVTDFNSGNSITVKDYIFKTKETEILEKAGSSCVNIGDLMIAKIIVINGQNFFSAPVLKTYPQYAEWIRDGIKKELKNKKITLRQFKEYSVIPTELTLKIKPAVEPYTFAMFSTAFVHLFMPTKLLNNEGEEIRTTNINFKIKDKARVLEGLGNEKYFDRDDNSDLWIWFEEIAEKNNSLPVGSRRILAQLSIKNDKLFCTVNSESRAKKLISIIQSLMENSIGIPVLEYEDIFSKENMEKAKSIPPKDDIPDYLQREIIYKILHENLKNSLNMKIPALGNKIPKQCAKTDKKLVIGWLVMMEKNINEQLPGGGYDISWAYKELGLK